MRMVTWFDGVKMAERMLQKVGVVKPVVYKKGVATPEFNAGWNDYVRNNARSQELARIEAEYCHAVVNVSYAMHTELEVLCILQQLQDKRRQQIKDLSNEFSNK